VIVDNDRIAAARKLLAVYNCNVIISDDGLQHYRLPRYIEIAVIDDVFGFGNGFCLPAGPLREPIDRLKSVDFIIRNFNASLLVSSPPQGEYSMVLEPTVFRNVKNPAKVKTADDFKDQVIHAMAGIGMPQKFFKTLRQLNLDIIEHPFQDHHMFSPADFSFTHQTVIMTEKDAVRCEGIAHDRFWYMEVDAKLDDKFIERLLDNLKKHSYSNINP
jgi:tetraacyldisaccharide 4'-kinase